jgi:alpha/beta superfamily hydrolase
MIRRVSSDPQMQIGSLFGFSFGSTVVAGLAAFPAQAIACTPAKWLPTIEVVATG